MEPGFNEHEEGAGYEGVSFSPSEVRLRAVAKAALFHGVEIDPKAYRGDISESLPSPASLVSWLRDNGLVAVAMRLKWRYLVRLGNVPPVVLLFKDGSAGLMVGTDPNAGIVWMRDPMGSAGDPAVAVDEMRLSHVWNGDVVMVRRARNASEDEQPFDMRWFIRLVMGERRTLRAITFASMVLAVISIIPPLIVMQVLDRVVGYNSLSTLLSITVIIVVFSAYEIFLTYARRELTLVMSSRIDARLSLAMFNRLLSLPLEFFERSQAGMTIGRVLAIYRVREFLTGRLMSTFLDMFTLVVILPFLFILAPALAWMVLASAGIIALIIVAFMPMVGRAIGLVVNAENRRGSVLYETVAGIRTVKTLALEHTRKILWDDVTAEVTSARLNAGRVGNLAQIAIMPFHMFINRGIILVGAYLIARYNLSGGSAGLNIGSGALVAFMMLGGRVASPLVSMARLLEDFTEVRSSLAEAGAVLNQPTETKALTTGMQPRIEGALSFNDVDFVYPGAQTKALDRVTFDVPAGTMLGLVGRSGSGKSTITRLLQGVSRSYTGFLKLDGVDLREINLNYLRRSFGVVLQDNFLFRGTIRDNITAGRPGLSIDDVVRAARLAGAEEFIERMPQGYETFIEEGSTNISGGQRQRLAIARALISDPKLMILDEATSALDPESEALVNANLQRIGRGRTMVIVSHRLSSLVDCDQILVMDRGKVIDIGPHKVLLERCAIYRQLWLQQNRHLDPQNGRSTPSAIPAEGDR